MPEEGLTFSRKTGEETSALFDDLAGLRIAVFRDFPYLYEGDPDYEKGYLEVYRRSGRSLIFAVYDGARMVGATTCIPLSDETPEVREPFERTGMDLEAIFYFGESLLLKEYRGLGLGHRFFDEREAHARSFGTFSTACFCAVDRPVNHPARPENYRPNDAFWTKRGYGQQPSLTSYFEWPDIGESKSTPKPMTYWIKSL